MTGNWLVIAATGVLCGLGIRWGSRLLPGERWQFFASFPVRKRDDDSWEAVNITWYGVILSGAAVFSVALYLIMLGGAGVPAIAGISLIILLLLVCVPASSLVARIVERKPATLTIGGAAFVGSLAAPFAILALNRFGEPLTGASIPMEQALAACAVAFLFGEGMGRMACLSYGCCYGKPVEAYGGLLGRIFSKTAVIFHGRTKKISYASDLEGRRVVPIQSLTMLVSSLAGIATLSLYASGHCAVAYLGATAFAGLWRIVSEFLRDDYRGEGRISAYQVMSGISVLYATVVTFFLDEARLFTPIDLARGVASLWNPGLLLFLAAIWFLLVMFTGVSATTFSRIRFYLRRDRI